MLKLDRNADANADFDSKYEWTFTVTYFLQVYNIRIKSEALFMERATVRKHFTEITTGIKSPTNKFLLYVLKFMENTSLGFK